MRISHFLPIAACVLLSAACDKKSSSAAAGGNASDGYVLATKGYLPPVGTITTKEMSMLMEGASVKINAGGTEMSGTATQTASGKETIEVLSKDKIRRTVVSKSTGGKMTMNGQDQDTPSQPDAMAGVPVIIERSGGTWTAKLESGAAATAEQQPRLTKMAKELEKDVAAAMYGDAPRKPGDKWTVDPANMTNFGDAEDASGTCSMEFVKVEDFQGTPCAVLKSTFDLKGKSAEKGAGKVSMSMRFQAESISHRSLADQVDLSVDVKGSMTIDGEPAPNFSMHMEGPTTFKETTSVKKP